MDGDEERRPQPEYSQQIAEGRDRARKELLREAAETHQLAEARRHLQVGDGHAVANTPSGMSPEFAGVDGLTADELLDLAGEVK